MTNLLLQTHGLAASTPFDSSLPLSLQYTLGLQVGEAPQYVKVGGCAKHYAIHDGPDDQREQIIYNVSIWDAWDTYFPQFRTVVTQGNVSQVRQDEGGVARSTSHHVAVTSPSRTAVINSHPLCIFLHLWMPNHRPSADHVRVLSGEQLRGRRRPQRAGLRKPVAAADCATRRHAISGHGHQR